MSATTIAIAILALAGLVVMAFLVANSNRRKARLEDVPPSMRPGYSDEQLERSVLERYMQWGVVLTVGLAVFVPVYWVAEANRLTGESEEFVVEAAVRGEEQYQANCSQCHSPNLGGGAAPSPYSDESWPAPALNNIVTRYADSANITDMRTFIEQTLHRGRPGTPMPTWGAAYGGPMTDQQISDITTYILLNQIMETSTVTPAVDMSGEELYQGNCAKCHGPDLQGIVGPSLIGVFERHSAEDVLGILRNGIYVPTGAVMPPFGQTQYQYEGATYEHEALEKIVDYLETRQPDVLPEGADRYQTPGIGQDEAAADTVEAE